MSTADSDPSDGPILYPLWVLFDAERLTGATVPGIEAAGLVPLPVFTRWDRALRFINRHVDEACALPLSRTQVEQFLVRFEQLALTETVLEIDPETPNAKRLTVAQLLAVVRHGE